MRLDADVLIVGGGLAGACMASLLSQRSRLAPGRITLVEPHLQPQRPAQRDIDLRVSAISRASERILSACNAWNLPSDRVNPFERMCVWDEAAKAHGNGALRFDCAEIGQPNLGYIVENSTMQHALLERARQAGVRILIDQVHALEPQAEAMAVVLQSGLRLNTALTVAADGADSAARTMMGIAAPGGSYRQRAIVTHIRTSETHRRTAWQRFLATGPIAALPLPDAQERRSSIVWSTTEDMARQLMDAPEAEFCKEVQSAFDGVMGEVLSCVNRADFPLRHLHAERYVTHRFALVGDAAHVIHPLAGQGVNLGFLDCAALAQVLDEALGGRQDVGDLKVLRRYERWRKGENLLMLAALDGINRLFSNTNKPLGMLRRAGLTAVDKVTVLKAQFMRRALGLTGDLPAIAAQ